MTEEIIIKFLLGESSELENVEMQAWLSANEKNQKYFNEMRLIWDTSKQLGSKHLESEDIAWKKFKARAEERKAERSKADSYNWLKIAASLILLIAISWLGYQKFKTPELIERLTVAQSSTVILPDESVVKLNKNSAMSYPEYFKGDKREIRLTKGEAFFTITPDSDKPFIIKTKEITIRVVGTSFNVKCSENSTEVIVASGKVKVMQKGNEISLNPNEKVIAHHQNQELKKEEVTDQLYQYYFTKTFVANGTPLWRIVEVLNEAYNVKIVIRNKDLENLPLTSTFKNESLEQILDVLKETFNLQIIKEDSIIILK